MSRENASYRHRHHNPSNTWGNKVVQKKHTDSLPVQEKEREREEWKTMTAIAIRFPGWESLIKGERQRHSFYRSLLDCESFIIRFLTAERDLELTKKSMTRKKDHHNELQRDLNALKLFRLFQTRLTFTYSAFLFWTVCMCSLTIPGTERYTCRHPTSVFFSPAHGFTERTCNCFDPEEGKKRGDPGWETRLCFSSLVCSQFAFAFGCFLSCLPSQPFFTTPLDNNHDFVPVVHSFTRDT